MLDNLCGVAVDVVGEGDLLEVPEVGILQHMFTILFYLSPFLFPLIATATTRSLVVGTNEFPQPILGVRVRPYIAWHDGAHKGIVPLEDRISCCLLGIDLGRVTHSSHLTANGHLLYYLYKCLRARPARGKKRIAVRAYLWRLFVSARMYPHQDIRFSVRAVSCL